MKFLYAKESGIIDWFSLAMTEEEAVRKFIENEKASGEGRQKNDKEARRCIGECVEQIKAVVNRETGEAPYIIRFFAIPNVDMLRFDLGAVAKVYNNGATFIFGDNKEIVEKFANSQFAILTLQK